MGVLGFPCVSELRDASPLAFRDEDGIEAEPLVSAGIGRHVPVERAGSAYLDAVRRKRDELADVASRAISLIRKSFQSTFDMPPARPARRLDARPAAEGGQLEPRVLAEHPLTRRADASAELGLRAGVLEERGTVLGRELSGVEELYPPAIEHAGELDPLVHVLRAEPRDYRVHLMPETSSSPPS